MSVPRQVLKKQFYLITRRCTQRQFLLRPDDATNNAFIYCLAIAARRCDVAVILSVLGGGPGTIWTGRTGVDVALATS